MCEQHQACLACMGRGTTGMVSLVYKKVIKKVFFLLNQILGTLRLRLVQVSKPPRSWGEFFSHVKGLGFKPSLIIDVGAADGTPELYKAYTRIKIYSYRAINGI